MIVGVGHTGWARGVAGSHDRPSEHLCSVRMSRVPGLPAPHPILSFASRPSLSTYKIFTLELT